MASKTPLPIDPLLPELVSTLKTQSFIVLQATAGSGKTTRVPQALLQADWRKPEKEILVLEPRRLAAKFAARRVSEEYGEPVGTTIGYHFRFESVFSSETRVRFLTEGMLMRYFLKDPTLSSASAVVLDEFHERHLHGDLAIALLRHLQKTRRPDLKLVVMSATLDTEKVSRFLDDCPILTLDTRLFPISLSYLSKPPVKPLELLVVDAAKEALERSAQGDILVFLPGMAEIRRAEQSLEAIAKRFSVTVAPLHSELSKEAQDFAIQKGDRRKIILSTNVAETSLTIEGVTQVIDSGLHRQASHSWWSGVPALKTKPISKASAEQRAGRAGRLAPGHCQRLYLKSDFDTRLSFEIPEIQRADLAATFLELKNLSIQDLSTFPWFEPPQEGAIKAAETLLFRLGAIDASGKLTLLGKQMVEFPAHPRLSRMLLEAQKRGVTEKAAMLAAQISEGALGYLDALEGISSFEPRLKRARDHFLSRLPQSASPKSTSWEKDLAFCVLTGFPDRIAKKRPHQKEVLLSSGGTAKLDDTPFTQGHDIFVALDLGERQFNPQAKAFLKVFSLVAIEESWLFDLTPTLLEERDVTVWDSNKQRAIGISQLAYDQLILAETESEPKDKTRAALLLLKEGLGFRTDDFSQLSLEDWCQALAKVMPREEIESTLVRILKISEATTTDMAQILSQILTEEAGTNLKAIQELPWVEKILSRFPELLGQYERLVPTSVKLPGGRNLKIHYELNKSPWVESRLQDFFGLAQGPAILAGKLPLTLHLLAPNFRAVQVTTDLSGFWERSYPSLRKELSRKYPRHSWPENPRHATPPPPKGKKGPHRDTK